MTLPRILHAVLVYRHRETGQIETRYADEPDVYQWPTYAHVATLDPALWIRVYYCEPEVAT